MIRVVVVDDHPVVRHGMVAMLRWEQGIEVVGEAADGDAAVALITDVRPDVVLLDLRMPGRDGVAVMRDVRAAVAGVRFLVLTTYDTDEYIGAALAAGAQGYLLKDAAPEELARAVHALMQGGSPLEPSVAARLIGRMHNQTSGEALSAREQEVLELLAVGASNRQIAVRLNLSENTIKTHLSSLFSKLGAQSRGEAVALGLQRGLIQVPRGER